MPPPVPGTSPGITTKACPANKSVAWNAGKSFRGCSVSVGMSPGMTREEKIFFPQSSRYPMFARSDWAMPGMERRSHAPINSGRARFNNGSGIAIALIPGPSHRIIASAVIGRP